MCCVCRQHTKMKQASSLLGWITIVDTIQGVQSQAHRPITSLLNESPKGAKQAVDVHEVGRGSMEGRTRGSMEGSTRGRRVIGEGEYNTHVSIEHRGSIKIADGVAWLISWQDCRKLARLQKHRGMTLSAGSMHRCYSHHRGCSEWAHRPITIAGRVPKHANQTQWGRIHITSAML